MQIIYLKTQKNKYFQTVSKHCTIQQKLYISEQEMISDLKNVISKIGLHFYKKSTRIAQLFTNTKYPTGNPHRKTIIIITDV